MDLIYKVWHHDVIGSTNDEARRLAAEGAPHGTVVHADQQTAGRGRLSRSWFSPAGNLYLSVLLRLETELERIGELSFVAALSVADTVEALLPRRLVPILKWPNDVLVNHAKIAGVLVEQEAGATILGIGLNVLESPSSAAYKTTTIVANGGIASVDSARDILLDRLRRRIMAWQAEGFETVRAEWMKRSYPLGTSIRVNIGDAVLQGEFAGLDTAGALLLDTADGRQRIVAGDVGVDQPPV